MRKEKPFPARCETIARLLKRHFVFGRKNLPDITRHDISQKLDKLKDTVSVNKITLSGCSKGFFQVGGPERLRRAKPLRGLLANQASAAGTGVDGRRTHGSFQDRTRRFNAVCANRLASGSHRSETQRDRGPEMGLDRYRATHDYAACDGDQEQADPSVPIRLLWSQGYLSTSRSRVSICFRRPETVPQGRPPLCSTGGVSPRKLLTYFAAFPTGNCTISEERSRQNWPHAGVTLPTIEKLLNHVSGSFGGIVAVYQRHDWLPEMRRAIEMWDGALSDADR